MNRLFFIYNKKNIIMKNNLENFIYLANKIHHNQYDYSLSEYINNITKIKIICTVHGVFEQNYKSHITKKYGCPKCGGVCKKTTEEFINDAIKIHSDKYDYSLVEYKNNSQKVKIICPIHGIFEQQPNKHLLGQGCLLCSGLKKKTTEEFINDAIKIHGNKYDYSLVKYENTDKKIKIICPIHGIFEQRPSSHLNGHNCNFCKKIYFKNEQHLYILIDKKFNIYKIGISIDVHRRCRELNSKYYKNEKNIEIISIFENSGTMENILHEKFKNNRIYHPTRNLNNRCDGRSEWFNFNLNDCINYINNR